MLFGSFAYGWAIGELVKIVTSLDQTENDYHR